MEKQRKSNFELLRIVAMLFIVTHHLVIKGASTCGYITTYDYNKDGVIGLLINSLVVVGVNLFVLISGYFGIKHTVKPLIKLAVDLTVYGIIAYLLGCLFLDVNFSIKGVIHGIDIHNWFVVNFALLVMTAPLLESALNNASPTTLLRWIVLLLLVNVLFGYLGGYVNRDGYNYVNFILLYVIARYIRVVMICPPQFISHIRKFGMAYWISSALVLAIGMVFLSKINHVPNAVHYFGYNNPVILFSSCCLFLVFASINVQSKWINLLATGMFGVFLMHTPPEIIPIRNSISSNIFHTYGYGGILLEAVALFSVLSLIAVPTEYFNKKISKAIYGFIKK